MRKILTCLITIVFAMALMTACGGAGSSSGTDTSYPSEGPGSNILVTYFSYSGNTQAVAEVIAGETGADIYEIEPAEPYTEDDIDYTDKTVRSAVEQADKEARPAINCDIPYWDDYEIVFVGYPIWFGDEPRVMDTFVETYDFEGKTVIPFCTSDNSPIGESGNNLAELAGSGEWTDGVRFPAEAQESEIVEWLDDLDVQLD